MIGKDHEYISGLINNTFSTSKHYQKNLKKALESNDILRNTVFTWLYLYRFSVVESRVFLRQPVILTGETGCGKTSII